MSTNSPDTLSREVATDGDREASLPAAQPAGLKTLDSHELMQGADQIVITHGEHAYRLRVTRNQKLILHK